MNSKNRFSDHLEDNKIFKWMQFYQVFADKLLEFRCRREELITGIHQIASKSTPLSIAQDQFADGNSAPLADICPFTTFGTFNRGLTVENCQAIAKELANLLDVSEDAPDEFSGIPVLNNQSSWFFLGIIKIVKRMI